MDSIIIGFSRPSGWFEPFSWLIRLAYWSPFSHVYIRFKLEKLGLNVIAQASGLKINLIEENLFDSKEIIYEEFLIHIDEKKKQEMISFIIKQLGKPYNLLGILGMGWVRIGQIFGLNFNSPFSYNGSSDFCSELVAHILQKYRDINFGKNPADISPQDVYNMLNKISGEKLD